MAFYYINKNSVMTDCSLIYVENFAREICLLKDERAMEKTEGDTVIQKHETPPLPPLSLLNIF